MSETAGNKILIVEDEMLIAADLSMQLTKLGYTVMGIHTRAEDLLKSLEVTRPDLILMDIILSGQMNGITAAHEIRDLYQIPVIFLTSNFDDATFQKAKAAKPHAFISKPFRREDLVRAIEITLERVKEEESDSKELEMSGEEKEITALDDRLFIRHKDELVRVPIKEILFLEADRNYCKIKTVEKEFLVSVPLGRIETALPNDTFIRTHRSFVVNVEQVSSINENYEYLVVDKTTLPVSRRMKESVMKRFMTL